jgi:hypothetical protein
MVALTGFSMLLTDFLLDHQQQIVAVWLLYSHFQTIPLPDNPFLPVFAFLYEIRSTSPNSCSPQLYDILANILSNSWPESIVECSVKTIMGPTFVIPTPKIVSISLTKAYTPRLSPILSQRVETKTGAISQEEMLVELLADSALYDDFNAPFIRPAPPLSPIFTEEFSAAFISSYSLPPPLFDGFLAISKREDVLSWIGRAGAGKLTKHEIDSLLGEIKSNRGLFLAESWPLDRLEALVENCPSVAIEFFKVLSGTDPKVLDFVVNSQITPNLAEIAAAVLTSPGLSEDVIEKYINMQLEHIHAIRDQQTYARKVTLLCRLLCDVVRKGVELKGSLVVDLHTFCTEKKNETIEESKELAELLIA